MTAYYDELEVRSPSERAEALTQALSQQLARARALPGWENRLSGVDPASVTSPAALERLPVLRKSDLVELQSRTPPFGGLTARDPAKFRNLFMSPGPIYEPGLGAKDWWRFGRCLHAVGIGEGDIVQNCFSYHMTPAGMMFENAAAAVGAAVLPAGTGQSELQARAAHDLGVTAYAGTPDYLKVVLDQASALGLELLITKAAVGGGALFPSLRAEYDAAGITCLQSYGTADLGHIAYETMGSQGPNEGMVVDEGVIVEIVRPGTGDRVPDGEVGEVVVTTLNPHYPLIRFATGDLSAVLPGQSPCGRTNIRIRGWMGRADQTTKIKGMFVRPEQVAELVARDASAHRARVIVTREAQMDVMTLRIETADHSEAHLRFLADEVQAVLKLRGQIELVAPGGLPNDGKVIDDRREYG